ncbi:hypothetical protein RB597_004729 [Gaeumannomyces tritici]
MDPNSAQTGASLQSYRDYAEAVLDQYGSRLSQRRIKAARKLMALCDGCTTPNTEQDSQGIPPQTALEAEHLSDELTLAVKKLSSKTPRRSLKAYCSEKLLRKPTCGAGQPSTATLPLLAPSPPPRLPLAPPGEGGSGAPDGGDLHPVQTSSAGLHCGMWALLGSLEAQLPRVAAAASASASAPPTAGELRGLFKRLASTRNNFYADDIDAVLREWGASRGLSLSLGVVVEGAPGGEGGLSYQMRDAADATIWIHNDNAETIRGAQYSHYSAMVARA